MKLPLVFAANMKILAALALQSSFPEETVKYSVFPAAQGCAAKISGCKLLVLWAIGKPRFSDGGR
ncbi:hypothetical protein [Immundisolibacter sp.]|uniref:hypothetical protein n=1 Tax=Immundisolibacter sp. TaxID=1934948 RepID=UPI003F4FE014